jgi:hypothetical protein
MFTASQIASVSAKAFAGEGYTEYRGADRYAGRYVVGGLSTAELATGTPLSDIQRAASLVADTPESETLGSWVESGVIYLDAGDTYDSLQFALVVARSRGELAIYDRMAQKVVTVA